MTALPSASKALQGAVRPGGRSARIVAEVLRATADELARVGYAALRVEDVARRARVNKTTVYRRWPTKMQLVTETLQQERERCVVTPDTGSVREDLRIMLHAFVEQGRTPLARAWLSELGNTEVRAIMRGFRHHFESEWVRVLARGMARGELPADTSWSRPSQGASFVAKSCPLTTSAPRSSTSYWPVPRGSRGPVGSFGLRPQDDSDIAVHQGVSLVSGCEWSAPA